ncbi:hypothetical protein SUGI_0224530 [Cryptomeria japonica]|nr:hypothetical protein SUGI_0224530 [Cryptomeria japonica]
MPRIRFRVVSFMGLCGSRPKKKLQSNYNSYSSYRGHNIRRRRNPTVRLGRGSGRRGRVAFRLSNVCCVKWVPFLLMVRRMRKMIGEVAMKGMESTTLLIGSHWAFPLFYSLH